MKIKKSYLKRIITEEFSKMLKEDWRDQGPEEDDLQPTTKRYAEDPYGTHRKRDQFKSRALQALDAPYRQGPGSRGAPQSGPEIDEKDPSWDPAKGAHRSDIATRSGTGQNEFGDPRGSQTIRPTGELASIAPGQALMRMAQDADTGEFTKEGVNKLIGIIMKLRNSQGL
jgi:hypothetical protein